MNTGENGTQVEVLTSFGGLRVRGELFTVKKTDAIFGLLVDYDILASGTPIEESCEFVTFEGMGNRTATQKRFWQAMAARLFFRGVYRVVSSYAWNTASERFGGW